jgi:hypothetical protein
MIPGAERAAALATNRRLRARIAHLRIQTIAHYARRGAGEANRQWALIDEQLVDLRARDPLYRQASVINNLTLKLTSEVCSFYRLIMKLDHEKFGNTVYSDMDVERIHPPTEEEVIAHMAVMAEDRAAAAPGIAGPGGQ